MFRKGKVLFEPSIIPPKPDGSCPKYPARPEGEYEVFSFVTPENDEIRIKARELMEQSGGMDPVKTCFDFVSLNIDYVSDMERHGMVEHWSLPCETLKDETGDCEDSSWLLDSLLLATAAIPDYDGEKVFPGEARVPLGRHGVTGHAWVEVLTDRFGGPEAWHILESTSDSPLELGKNVHTLEDGYRNGYAPEWYVYNHRADLVGDTGLYDRWPRVIEMQDEGMQHEPQEPRRGIVRRVVRAGWNYF